MLNLFSSTKFGFLIIILSFIFTVATNSVAQQTGTLTGTITSPEGKPINADSGLLATGVFINLEEHSRAVSWNAVDFRTRGIFNDVENGRSRVSSNSNLSGYYSFKNLRPGVYNLVVEAGVLPDNERRGYTYYRPQRIVGIVVKPGEETVFDIVMNVGDKVQNMGNPQNNTLEMVGEPKGNTQEGLKWGWIEGTVTNPEGQPIWSVRTLLVSGIALTLKKSTGEQVTIPTDHLVGGFFSAFNLKPGMYSIILEKGIRYKTAYRPQIIGQVMIKAGVRTILNITMNPGDTLERTTALEMESQKITLASK